MWTLVNGLISYIANKAKKSRMHDCKEMLLQGLKIMFKVGRCSQGLSGVFPKLRSPNAWANPLVL